LFLRRGYIGTTMDAIAQAANVAPSPCTPPFGSQRAVLDRLIAVSLVGDEQPIPLLDREGPRVSCARRTRHVS